MQTLQITKKKAIKAYKKADTSGKELLENLLGKENVKQESVTDRIKTICDALEDLDINPSEFTGSLAALPSDEKAYKSLKIIAQALNEGWKPDWNNPNEIKYYPWFNLSNGFRFYDCDYYYRYSRVGSRLCFRSRELAEYAGKQFTELYKDFMTF